MTGASGFVGKELYKTLIAENHEVITLVRDLNKCHEKAFFWDPEKGVVDSAVFKDVDAVINLAGENIADKRWSKKQKKKILESRVNATKTLVKALIALKNPPTLLINASAIGIYGNRGDEILTENSLPGTGFLSEVCQKWEAATDPLLDKGIRVVLLRTGLVLSCNGGVLEKMLPIFKLGLGGIIGSGKQYMSFITLYDLISIILFTLSNKDVRGPINGVAKTPITNTVFTKSLGKQLRRFTFFKVPAFILKLLFGQEMANELFLGSSRVVSKKLEGFDFSYKHPDIDTACKSLLGTVQ